MAPIIPEFPSKLDSGERVFPIRLSIGKSSSRESSDGLVGELFSHLIFFTLLLVN
jgi:hypothetical protein